jgi:hypothetical protein
MRLVRGGCPAALPHACCVLSIPVSGRARAGRLLRCMNAKVVTLRSDYRLSVAAAGTTALSSLRGESRTRSGRPALAAKRSSQRTMRSGPIGRGHRTAALSSSLALAKRSSSWRSASTAERGAGNGAEAPPGDRASGRAAGAGPAAGRPATGAALSGARSSRPATARIARPAPPPRARRCAGRRARPCAGGRLAGPGAVRARQAARRRSARSGAHQRAPPLRTAGSSGWRRRAPPRAQPIPRRVSCPASARYRSARVAAATRASAEPRAS